MKLTERDLAVSWIAPGHFYLTTANTLPDDYELCIEPCLEGWDVALYRKHWLVRPKVCTRVPLDIERVLKVMAYGEQWQIVGEHLEALAPALDIANRVLGEELPEYAADYAG